MDTNSTKLALCNRTIVAAMQTMQKRCSPHLSDTTAQSSKSGVCTLVQMPTVCKTLALNCHASLKMTVRENRCFFWFPTN